MLLFYIRLRGIVKVRGLDKNFPNREGGKANKDKDLTQRTRRGQGEKSHSREIRWQEAGGGRPQIRTDEHGSMRKDLTQRMQRSAERAEAQQRFRTRRRFLERS